MSPNGSSSASRSSSASSDHESNTIPKLRVRAATNDFSSPPPDTITGQLSHIAITSPGPSKPPISLEKQLWKHAVRHAIGSTNSFWPPSIWQALVTEQAIVDELMDLGNKFNPTTALAFAKQILRAGSEQSLTVFTILLLSDKLNTVDHILRHCEYGGIRDEDLPLVLRSDSWGDDGLFHRNGDQVAACCLYRWKTVQLEAFDNFQRRLSPPVFGLKQEDNTLIHLDLDDHAILPWCEFQENLIPVPVMSGGFGTVSRVKIHPMCHIFHDTLKAVSSPGPLLFLVILCLFSLGRVQSSQLILIFSDQCSSWTIRRQEAQAKGPRRVFKGGRSTSQIQW